jgi:threonine/homoserine/homoserine lactone efflux protein
VHFVVLGLLFIALGMCCDGPYVVVAGALSRRLRDNPTFARLRDRVAGSIFVTLGVVAARARRAAA